MRTTYLSHVDHCRHCIGAASFSIGYAAARMDPAHKNGGHGRVAATSYWDHLDENPTETTLAGTGLFDYLYPRSGSLRELWLHGNADSHRTVIDADHKPAKATVSAIGGESI